jgi:hypothetical protein
MTEEAKNILKVKGWQEFKYIYGNYWIKMISKGASMQVIVKTKLDNKSTSTAVLANLATLWNGFGTTGSLAANFYDDFSKATGFSDKKINVYYSG